MILMIATVAFLVAYAGLIFFYRHHWLRLKDVAYNSKPSLTVSVIVAARNEEKTLPLLLKNLQQQQYPSSLFEVIVVNDFSTDGTAKLANTLPSNFWMISPPGSPDQSSKKKALAAGIEKAKGPLLLITDADCSVPPNWIAAFAAFHQNTGAVFIAAPVKYKHDASFLQVFQTLDFLTLQGITAASVAANFHSMCNGANLAYTKEAFNSVNGFAGIDKVASGDDMLLMYKIWKKHPGKVAYLKCKEVLVTTEPATTWKSFFNQRLRWAGKSTAYDDYRIVLVLLVVLAINLLPFLWLITVIFQPPYWWTLPMFIGLKTAIEWPFVQPVARFYGEEKLLRYFILFQPLHIFYTVFVGICSQLFKYEWKGRRPVA